MAKVIRYTESELVQIVENSVNRALALKEETNAKKKYHLTEAELRGVIQHFVEKSNTK